MKLNFLNTKFYLIFLFSFAITTSCVAKANLNYVDTQIAKQLDKYLEIENIEFKNVYFLIEPPASDDYVLETQITLGQALMYLNKFDSRGVVHFDVLLKNEDSKSIDHLGHIALTWNQGHSVYNLILKILSMALETDFPGSGIFKISGGPDFDNSRFYSDNSNSDRETEKFKLVISSWNKSNLMKNPYVSKIMYIFKWNKTEEVIPITLNLDVTYFKNSDSKTIFNISGDGKINNDLKCDYQIHTNYNPFIDNQKTEFNNNIECRTIIK